VQPLAVLQSRSTRAIGVTANGVDIFLDIPFAQPPFVANVDIAPCSLTDLSNANRVGDLHFRHLQEPDPHAGIHYATAFCLSCPQQTSVLALPNELPQQTVDYLRLTGTGLPRTVLDGEDCKEAIVEASYHHTKAMAWTWRCSQPQPAEQERLQINTCIRATCPIM
jgi:hypothetical protein